jgi:pentatricopeptide repeat protein
MDALWSDEDGAAAREACKIALHRLRKLLGNPNTVQVEDGRVSVNPREVWVDANAFEQAADTGADSGRIEGLYQGQFLPEEREAPWALSPRERLRGKFIRHVAREGLRLEQAGDLDAAASWYQRGIDADDLAEEFYQGLIRCHIKRGRHADAMTVYRRLRQILSVTLGISPSRESEGLFRSVQQA